MKKFILIYLSILVMTSFANASPIRDVNAIAMNALQKGLISESNIKYDFTKIPQGAKYRQDAILVRFVHNPDGKKRTIQEKNEILSSIGGGSIKRNYNIVPELSLVELPKDMTVEKALAAYNNTKSILYAEPDYEGSVTSTTPNDTYFSNLWGMNQTYDHDIDAPEAWDIETGSSDIIVAVIDSGVAYNHSDLAGNMWINSAEYGGNVNVDDDGNGFIDDIYGYDFCTYGQSRDSYPYDDLNHGTHVAGTIGAVGNNSIGVTGVCWNVRIMAVKWISSSDHGYTSDAIDSIEYAIMMGADIMNNSWRIASYSQSLKDAIDDAATADIIFVAAAGNTNYYGNDNDTNPVYPASYDCDNIISVLATNQSDYRCSFSHYGSESVDLGAPGDDIYSCINTGGYDEKSGTSMAAPHVAGACALLLSMNQDLTYGQIKDIIMNNTDYKSSLSGLCVSEGRLNIYNAVSDDAVFEDPEDPEDPENPPDTEVYFLGMINAENENIWFDKYGNLVATGTFTANTSCTQSGYDGMKVYNSGGSSVIALVDSDAGNMKISGSCYESQGTLSPPSGCRLIIKDESGNVLAYLTNTGNLYLKGAVYDNI